MMLLAAAAGQTSTLRLGHLVASATFGHPALLDAHDLNALHDAGRSLEMAARVARAAA